MSEKETHITYKSKELSARDLSKKLFNTKTNHVVIYQELDNAMYTIRRTLPDAFCFHFDHQGHRVIHLKREYYNQFLSAAGFVDLGLKTDNDMDSSDIAKLYNRGEEPFNVLMLILKRDLIENNDKKSELIEYKTTSHFNGSAVVCMDKSLLKKFVKKFDLKRRNKKKTKFTKNLKKDVYNKPVTPGIWKKADELRSYIDFPCNDMTSEAINTLLEEFQGIMYAAVKSFDNVDSYSMNLRYLDKLCKYSGFKKNPVPRKNTDWKSCEELAKKYIQSTVENITSLMNDFYLKMPDIIQVRKDYTTNQDKLCLDVNHLRDFCKVSNLTMVPGTLFAQKPKHDEQAINRQNYLSAVELTTNYFYDDSYTIRKILRKTQNKLPLEAIRVLKFRRSAIYLNKNYIKDFYQLNPELKLRGALNEFDEAKNNLLPQLVQVR